VARAASRWRGLGRYRGEPVDDDQTCVQHWRDVGGRWEMFTEQCVNPTQDGLGRRQLSLKAQNRGPVRTGDREPRCHTLARRASKMGSSRNETLRED
jgi:hypothetical protein